MTNTNQPIVIEDNDLEAVNGGLIGLLLPAVQKVRDGAARTNDVNGDGRADIIVGASANGANGPAGYVKP